MNPRSLISPTVLLRLSLVKVIEIGDNDWDGKGESQDTRYGTEGTHNLSKQSNRYFVTVAKRL